MNIGYLRSILDPVSNKYIMFNQTGAKDSVFINIQFSILGSIGGICYTCTGVKIALIQAPWMIQIPLNATFCSKKHFIYMVL